MKVRSDSRFRIHRGKKANTLSATNIVSINIRGTPFPISVSSRFKLNVCSNITYTWNSEGELCTTSRRIIGRISETLETLKLKSEHVIHDELTLVSLPVRFPDFEIYTYCIENSNIS